MHAGTMLEIYMSRERTIHYLEFLFWCGLPCLLAPAIRFPLLSSGSEALDGTVNLRVDFVLTLPAMASPNTRYHLLHGYM